MEFRKEEDKEEVCEEVTPTPPTPLPPPLAATLPTFHTGLRTLPAAAPGEEVGVAGGRIGAPLHPEHGAHQAALLSTTGPQSENISGESCKAAAESTNAALETHWGGGV